MFIIKLFFEVTQNFLLTGFESLLRYQGNTVLKDCLLPKKTILP